MADIIPTVGRIVLYTISTQDVASIRDQRARAGTYQGNDVYAGDVYPAMVIRAWGNKPDSYVNLKVMLDGYDTYWATSRKAGAEADQGFYHWMPYQIGQAAKTEAAEAALEAKA